MLGLDRDAAAIERVAARLEAERSRLELVQSDFRTLASVAREHGFAPCSGVLLDLGLSSDQLAAPERGFSFQQDGPLDMRFDRADGQTAAELLNTQDESELADIFYEYGEERRSRRFAEWSVRTAAKSPVRPNRELVEAVEAASRRTTRATAPRHARLPGAAHRRQRRARRRWSRPWRGAPSVLEPGGRLAVISFHSLEDRIVKRFIRSHSASETEPTLRDLARKPLVASEGERERNPRSRSAKLRIAERLDYPPVQEGRAMAQIATELPSLPVPRLPALPTIRWRIVGLLVTALFVLGGLSASYLAYIGNVATTNYTIQRLQDERDLWRNRNAQLRVELAKARSLTWIEHEAVGRLRMQKASQLIYLQVEPSSVARSAEAQPRQAGSR